MAHLKTDTSANSHFATVPQISHSRNSFSLAERHLTTIQFDKLYPVFQKHIYPGDTISMQHSLLARLQTQIAVLFDDLYVDLHAWFVPFRIIDKDWARFQFNTQEFPGQDNSALRTISLAAVPAGGFASKSIYDYFGYPTLKPFTVANERMSALPILAYNKIWNDNYRDENLQNPIIDAINPSREYINDPNGPLLPRGKRHDIFTSALPFQQKGPASTIPATFGSLPVTRVNNAALPVKLMTPGANTAFGGLGNTLVANANSQIQGTPSNLIANIDPMGTLEVVMNAINLFTINQLRSSVAVQHLLENDARGGTRDVESIKHRWGATVPDFRMNRPEYLGGTTFSFDGHIVPQTSETGTTPQGTLKQFSQTTNAFSLTHSFVEHGIMMILISARSNITYQQGLPKEYSYSTRYDWYQPEFANLGEVAIKNKEIYFQGTAGGVADQNTFGYQEYGYELRYGLNRVSAEFKSNYALTLDYKHMADNYSSLPTLGPAWIQSNTSISRNIAVSASVSDPIELNMLATGKHVRTLPMYSVPGLNRL